MKKTDLLTRLTALEAAEIHRFSNRVSTIGSEAGKSFLEELLAEIDGHLPEGLLSPSERIEYWQRKVDEAETLITQKGAAPDDDNVPNASPATMAILRELRYEIACEEIAEFRQKLQGAKQASQGVRGNPIVSTQV